MFLFWRLLVAHLVGDFPLQTDRVFELKQRGGWGVSLHGSIVGVLFLLLSLPYLFLPWVWGGVFLLWLAHVFFDSAKVRATSRLGLKGEHLSFFLLDQFFHIGLTWLVCRWLVGSRIAGSSIPIYGDTQIMQYLCGYLVTTYGATILVWSTRRTVLGGEDIALPNSSLKWREFLERGMVTTGALLGSWWFVLVPLGLLPRGILVKRKGRVVLIDLVLSVALALGVGMVLRLV